MRNEAMIDKQGIGVAHNVRAYVRDAKTGNLLFVASGHNLVVNSGLAVMRDHFAGVGWRPDTLRADSSPLESTAFSEDPKVDVIISKLMDRRIPTGDNVIEFQALIGSNEGNNSFIRAVSTWERDRMIARSLIEPVITKTALVTVTLSHTFTFFATEPV